MGVYLVLSNRMFTRLGLSGALYTLQANPSLRGFIPYSSAYVPYFHSHGPRYTLGRPRCSTLENDSMFDHIDDLVTQSVTPLTSVDVFSKRTYRSRCVYSGHLHMGKLWSCGLISEAARYIISADPMA